jgi:hypothetical protein
MGISHHFFHHLCVPIFAVCCLSVLFLTSARPSPIRAKPHISWAFNRGFGYPDFQDHELLEFMVGPSAMARPFVAPPGVSADKAALLRRAFDATMQDGEFRAEAARMQADLAPTTGEYVQKLVARIYATPRPVVERVKKLLAP